MSTVTNAVQPQDQAALIAQLMAEIQSLKASGKRSKKDTTSLIDGLSAAVSEKGAISVYGLGRFPVTLYKHQFERLASAMPLILAFIAQNGEKLVSKPVAVK